MSVESMIDSCVRSELKSIDTTDYFLRNIFEDFRDKTKEEVYRLRDVDKMLKEELEEVKNENVELKNKVEKLEKMMENLIKNLDNKKSKNYFDLEL